MDESISMIIMGSAGVVFIVVLLVALLSFRKYREMGSTLGLILGIVFGIIALVLAFVISMLAIGMVSGKPILFRSH